MKKTKSKKPRGQLEIDEKKIFATKPGRVARDVGIIAMVGIITSIVIDILVSVELLPADYWQYINSCIDQVAWMCAIVAASIFLTASYFVNLRKKQ